MLQSQRTWLYNYAYSLDNRRRIRGGGSPGKELLFVVFTHEELEKMAAKIREMAANDEDRIVENVIGKKAKG